MGELQNEFDSDSWLNEIVINAKYWRMDPSL
jgi:hypothetical protein